MSREQHELKREQEKELKKTKNYIQKLESSIQQFEKEISDVEAIMGKPDFFASNDAREILAKHASIKKQLDDAVEKWTELQGKIEVKDN